MSLTRRDLTGLIPPARRRYICFTAFFNTSKYSMQPEQTWMQQRSKEGAGFHRNASATLTNQASASPSLKPVTTVGRGWRRRRHNRLNDGSI